MATAINWHDSYYMSSDRIVLTNHEILVPGVRVLAHHSMNSCIAPLNMHFHENCFEFTLIEEGVFMFQSEEKNYKASGGNIFIAFPNEIHSTNGMPLSYGEIYWLQIEVNDPDNLLFLNRNAAANLIDGLNKIPHHIVKIDDDRRLSHLLHEAFKLAITESSPSLIAGYLNLFLNLLISISTTPKTLSREIYNALNYIFDHIEEEIPLEILARCSNLSVPQFKARFKHEIGVSPRGFINLQKIEKAKEMLADGYGITETALYLSFNTSSYFSTVFKKYTLLTPSHYIRALSKKS